MRVPRRKYTMEVGEAQWRRVAYMQAYTSAHGDRVKMEFPSLALIEAMLSFYSRIVTGLLGGHTALVNEDTGRSNRDARTDRRRPNAPSIR